jgi:putative ABC transport system substrate-binding protein
MQLDRLNRRELLTLLGGAATAAWPLALQAQQSGRLPTIGFIASGTPETQGHFVTAFMQRLLELGWVEGRTVALQVRWADGRSERFTEFAAELVRLKVDMIVTPSTPVVIAAKQASSAIPIVFAGAGDPIGSGLVASLARPGGNVTGLSQQSAELAGKRLALLREVIPGLRRLAIMANVENPPSLQELTELERLTSGLGIETTKLVTRRPEDIALGFQSLKSAVDAVYTVNDPVVNSQRVRIITLALVRRLPTMYGLREFATSGGLMSYGPNLPSLFRRAAEMADKILRGAKPADIPVEQPTKFDLVINLFTAKAIGVEVPSTVIAQADEVIE